MFGHPPSLSQRRRRFELASLPCLYPVYYKVIHPLSNVLATRALAASTTIPVQARSDFGTSLLNDLRKSLGELGHEGNHEVEKTDGLDESETQNGVGEELATEGRVAGNTVQESGEDETDTDTGTGKTNGSGTHTNVLGDLNHGLGNLGGVGTLLDLEGVAGGGLQEVGLLLALEGLEGRSGTGDGALGGSSQGSSGNGASGLGGHLGSQAGGEDTGGGHFDGCEVDGDEVGWG
jgi:hypothetical protein